MGSRFETVQDVADKLEWEGHEYAATDIRPEDMPNLELEDKLRALQRAWEEFFAYLEGLVIAEDVLEQLGDAESDFSRLKEHLNEH